MPQMDTKLSQSGKCCQVNLPDIPQCLATTSTFNICSRCSLTLKGTVFAFFPCDLRVRFEEGKKLYVHMCVCICVCIHEQTFLFVFCVHPQHPGAVVGTGFSFPTSIYARRTRGTGHHRRYMAGLSLSSPVRSTSRQNIRPHKHVSTSGALSKSVICVPAKKAGPSHLPRLHLKHFAPK